MGIQNQISLFFPTRSSTKGLIKQENERGGPKEKFAKVSALVGRILKAMCSGHLPRNEKKDCKLIRALKFLPDLTIVFATDQQLHDLTCFAQTLAIFV